MSCVRNRLTWQVDVVAGDFNGAAWRKKNGDDQQHDSTIEEALVNTHLRSRRMGRRMWVHQAAECGQRVADTRSRRLRNQSRCSPVLATLSAASNTGSRARNEAIPMTTCDHSLVQRRCHPYDSTRLPRAASPNERHQTNQKKKNPQHCRGVVRTSTRAPALSQAFHRHFSVHIRPCRRTATETSSSIVEMTSPATIFSQVGRLCFLALLGTRFKRRPRFHKAAAIKLHVCNGKPITHTHPWNERAEEDKCDKKSTISRPLGTSRMQATSRIHGWTTNPRRRSRLSCEVCEVHKASHSRPCSSCVPPTPTAGCRGSPGASSASSSATQSPFLFALPMDF